MAHALTHADVTPMNQQILRFDLSADVELDEAAMDRHIEGALHALFDDLDSNPVPCMNYYCTGYWPDNPQVTDLDTVLPA
ncbi:MAG: hypothetical protein AAGE94_05350 [Acidobacteriota bacterium]